MLALGRPIATVLSIVTGVGIKPLRGELDVHCLCLIRAQRKQKAAEWRTTRSAQRVVRQVSQTLTIRHCRTPTGSTPAPAMPVTLIANLFNPGSLERCDLVLIHEEAPFLFDLKLEVGLRQRELTVRHE